MNDGIMDDGLWMIGWWYILSSMLGMVDDRDNRAKDSEDDRYDIVIDGQYIDR